MENSYELKGRVQRLIQRRKCNPRLRHLPDHNCFDVEFSLSGRILEITTYYGSLSIRDIEHFRYDSLDCLTLTIRVDARGAETSRTEYQHNRDGFCVSSITRDPREAILSRDSNEYENGRLIKSSRFRADGIPILRKSFRYEEGKLRSSESEYFGPNGELHERWFATYNIHERIAENFGLNPDGSPLGDGRYFYEYDQEGRRTRVLSFNDTVADGSPNHISRFEYLCDANGNWIEQRELSRFCNEFKYRDSITIRSLTYCA